MNIKKLLLITLFYSAVSWSQETPLTPSIAPPSTTPAVTKVTTDDSEVEKPNGRRLRRQLNLILGVDHDEEILIPQRDILIKGVNAKENFDIKRLKNTDFFRFAPLKKSNGIATINDAKTGQILVEIRYDIRDGDIEKRLRELKSLLGDIEGLEYKIVNDKVLLDGYVFLPRELLRIANVVNQFGKDNVKSLVSLSPLARKKIAEYISRDVNNPEVSISAVGDYFKLEGVVNSDTEKKRIISLVSLYMPDLVVDKAGDLDNLTITGKKTGGKLEDFIIDLITIKKDDEKSEPPPKMIQVVVHFVQFIENYQKNFRFVFAPSLAAVSTVGRAPSSTINDTANFISNLLPKLQWAKSHGYARVLDTASILTQDKKKGNYTNTITVKGTPIVTAAGSVNTDTVATVSVDVTPTIKSERSGLIELPVGVSVDDADTTKTSRNTVSTTISVRDRQSAAFAGIIKKKATNEFGGDPGVADAVVTFQSKKKYDKSSSNFVVFITPIIKSSASAGVDQVKKKFRLRE